MLKIKYFYKKLSYLSCFSQGLKNPTLDKPGAWGKNLYFFLRLFRIYRCKKNIFSLFGTCKKYLFKVKSVKPQKIKIIFGKKQKCHVVED